MVNDLTPICKALIGLFAAQHEPLTVSTVERQLPHADQAVMHDTLQMLVRADVVRQAFRRVQYSSERELVYWLAGNDVGEFAGTRLHYPESVTLADVGGVTGTNVGVAPSAEERKELRVLRLAQKAITSEIEYVLRGGREANHG
ncbi:hypothetical protein [Paraburkholderia dilworthii]|uniref:IclR helix-turn-helix domain-containing protein n=1 Tax=Paraburkholderia dilworthii TaxID=948106 RepID=A0ABW9D8W7_9BURK